jgi:hypothetical protein
MTDIKPGDRVRHKTITGLVGTVVSVWVIDNTLDVRFPFTSPGYCNFVCAADFELDKPSLEEVLRANPEAVVVWSDDGFEAGPYYVRAIWCTAPDDMIITAVRALGPELWRRDDG